jgi:peptide deformylase
MILKVAKLGVRALRKKANPVSRTEILSARFQSLLDNMIDTMRDYKGVGIAAPQVRVGKQVFCVECVQNPRYPGSPHIPLYIVINPKLQILDKGLVRMLEGCLSIPGLRGEVARARKVRVEGLNRLGKPMKVTAVGFHARILQHEFDHLQGRVYLDRLKNMRTLH